MLKTDPSHNLMLKTDPSHNLMLKTDPSHNLMLKTDPRIILNVEKKKKKNNNRKKQQKKKQKKKTKKKKKQTNLVHISTLYCDPRLSFQYYIMIPRVSFQWGPNLMLHRKWFFT